MLFWAAVACFILLCKIGVRVIDDYLGVPETGELDFDLFLLLERVDFDGKLIETLRACESGYMCIELEWGLRLFGGELSWLDFMVCMSKTVPIKFDSLDLIWWA